MKTIDNLAALILSAGHSQRMGRFKPLLPLGAGCVLERVVDIYRTAGLRHIVVVAGHRAAELQAALAGLAVQWVLNPDYDLGMFSSILAGLRGLPDGCDAFFIHPVDIPLVRSQTVRQLVAAWQHHPASVFHPAFAGRRGHPPLIGAALRPQILQWGGRGGLAGFLGRQDPESLEVPVADEAVLLDLDTPEDYRFLLARDANEGIPSLAECRVLMEQIAGLPEAVARHGQAVATVAQVLTAAMNAAGGHLDAELVHAAALLHDIARTAEAHAEAGGRLLEAHGFSRLAPIVRVHMDMPVVGQEPVDEAQVVYLADKLVRGDQRVDLEQRFGAKMAKYGQDPSAATAIARRKEHAVRIQTKVERLTGRAIGAILDEAGLRPGERL